MARRVAKLSRHLAVDKVGVVDSAISRMIATEAVGRVLEVAEAKVIEADTELHEERCEAERRRRYVGLGRTDEYGLRTLIARLEAGDAVAVDAIVHRVGEIIAPRHPDASPDELRALAFGWLARPAELFALLLEHSTPPTSRSRTSTSTSRSSAVACLRLPRRPPRRTARPRPHARSHRRPCSTSTSTRPRSTRGDGVARVEGFGPVTVARLTELLRGSIIKVQPVKDLSDRVRYTAYEHPESLRDQVHLVTGGDYWPWASLHQPQGRPRPPDPVRPRDGETARSPAGPDRLPQLRPPRPTTPPLEDPRGLQVTPVRRRPLRLADPHGLGFLVDHTGTHRIHPEKARMILDAPVGVDIYPG